MAASWDVIRAPSRRVHVVPRSDTRVHKLVLECWCHPKLEECGLIVHASADGRELDVDGCTVPRSKLLH